MQANWFSRKGSERTRNSDAAVMGQQDQYVFAVLVDGAEKGPRGAELASHWAGVAFHALAEFSVPSPTAINARLKHEQGQLRQRFLHDIASYCMVSLDLETLAAHIWHCGDCYVGLRYESQTQWLTTAHILAQQPGIPSSHLIAERDRHAQQLTRCLNARRFRAPDYQSLILEQGQALLLCTDGYWQGLPRDDASLLTLPVEFGNLDHIAQESDADNLNYFRHA